MSYPNSSPVQPGDPTEAAQYNDLRKDAIHLGADPAMSGTLRDLLYQLTGNIRLTQNGTTGIRLNANAADPCGVMISGVIHTVTSNTELTITAADFPAAGKYDLYAAGENDGSFRLEAGLTAPAGGRKIGEFTWTGTGIIPGTLRNISEINSDPQEPAGNGRLTLVSSTPVPDIDITSGTQIYFTPYRGNRIGIYTPGGWENFSFTEMSLSFSGFVSQIPYDIFIRADENGLALTAEPWANTSVRASGLQYQNGIRVSGADRGKRYLGTIALNASGKGEDSRTGRLVWNENNRVSRPLLSRLVSANQQVTGTENAWVPYYMDEAPEIRLLVPSEETEFEIEGVGIGTPVTENDQLYQRWDALGIGLDMNKTNPNLNSSCVPVFTHNSGSGPLNVRIRNGATPGQYQGLHTYTLAWMTNFSSFRPEGTQFSALIGEAPGLFGHVKG